ncbi:MAG: hypothetical protein AAGG79_07055 [Pseudomonadota bacterium]
MNPIVTILTTAALTAGSLRLAKAVRARFRQRSGAEGRLRGHPPGGGDGGVIDLEADAETGVYGLARNSR